MVRSLNVKELDDGVTYIGRAGTRFIFSPMHFFRRNVCGRGAPLNSIWASTCPPYLKSMWAQMEMQMLYVGQYMTDGARRYGGCWGHDMCNRSTWAKVSEKLCFGFCSRINLGFKFTLAVGGGQLEGIVWMNRQCDVLNLPSKWFKLT